jgi:hypothetical protein
MIFGLAVRPCARIEEVGFGITELAAAAMDGTGRRLGAWA